MEAQPASLTLNTPSAHGLYLYSVPHLKPLPSVASASCAFNAATSPSKRATSVLGSDGESPPSRGDSGFAGEKRRMVRAALDSRSSGGCPALWEQTSSTRRQRPCVCGVAPGGRRPRCVPSVAGRAPSPAASVSCSRSDPGRPLQQRCWASGGPGHIHFPPSVQLLLVSWARRRCSLRSLCSSCRRRPASHVLEAWRRGRRLRRCG